MAETVTNIRMIENNLLEETSSRQVMKEYDIAPFLVDKRVSSIRVQQRDPPTFRVKGSSSVRSEQLSYTTHGVRDSLLTFSLQGNFGRPTAWVMYGRHVKTFLILASATFPNTNRPLVPDGIVGIHLPPQMDTNRRADWDSDGSFDRKIERKPRKHANRKTIGACR